VENSETGAQRSLVVSKHVPRQAYAGIEVVIGWVGYEGMGHVLVGVPKGRAYDVVVVVASLDRIGFPVVAQPQIDGQAVVHLPIVLNVGLE